MDVQLYYQEKGNGEPLILLHGNGEDSSYFEHQLRHFSRSYHVFALDTRGHGSSPRGTAPFTIEQFARDLYAFMQQHRLPRAVLLGFSDGANIAMKFARKHPEMVRALILNGGNLNAKGVKRTTQLPIELGYRIAARFAERSPRAKANAEMLGLMVNDPNIAPEELAEIQAPALVICGTRDMIREAHTREIAAALPYAQTVFIKGDHFIANKRPEEFNRAVDAFLQSVETAF